MALSHVGSIDRRGDVKGRSWVYRFWKNHRKVEYINVPVVAGNFWFCNLPDESCDRNQERIRHHSTGWIRVKFFLLVVRTARYSFIFFYLEEVCMRHVLLGRWWLEH